MHEVQDRDRSMKVELGGLPVVIRAIPKEDHLDLLMERSSPHAQAAAYSRQPKRSEHSCAAT